MDDEKNEKKKFKVYRPTFEPEKFKNKWEAKITYMLLNALADIVETEKRVIELEKKLKQMEKNNDKKSMH